MELTETCGFCGRSDLASKLGLWFVKNEQRPIHMDCWIAAYQSGRLYTGPIRRTA
jgi:hypothetical protein